ncbi:MAG: PAS domain S-box protein [Ferruginibacter sp.]|nr:PAS domain S-box protein [Ferruginibacter sp.]
MGKNKSHINALDAGTAQEMLLSAKKFRALVENNDAIIALLDKNLVGIYRSPASARITGRAFAEFDKIEAVKYIHPEDLQLVQQVLAEALKNPGKTISITVRYLHKNGHWLWLEGTVTNMLHDEDIQGIITNMRDVTARKEAEEKLHKIKRLYNFISQVNQLIVRTADETALFKEACAIAVETGKFKMAWIGVINEEAQSLVPVMHAGEENGYLDAIKSITLKDVPEKSLLIVNALQQDSYFICNDIENDSAMLPWKEEALRRGYRSLICLPIKKSGKLFGVFVLYGGTTNFFNEEEILLLKEATGDIEFALDNFDKEEKRKKTEAEIEKMYRDKETLLNRINDGMISLDNEWRYTFINDAALATHPLGRAATLGQVIWDIHPDMKSTVFWDKYHEAKATGNVVEIESFYEPMQRWFSVKVYPSTDGLTVFYNDITDRLKAHEEIIKERNLSDSIINSLPGIFYLYNQQGKFLRWNTNFETVTGFTGEEIKQMHPLDFFDVGEKDLLTQKISNVFVAGEDSVQAGFYLKNKKKIPYYFTGKAVQYHGELCLLGVGIDFADRVMAQEKIRETTEQLRMLTAHLQHIREEERKRIGREIHDDLGQQLTAIKMDVAWLDRKMPEEQTLYKTKLKNIIGMLDSSNQAIRRILSELRPGILDDYGLLEAIEWLGSQFTTHTGIPFKFTCNEKRIHAAEPVITCIFRIYQEALTNITRYAHAAAVNSSLTVTEDFVTVKIKDDGKGFDTASIQTHKSFGILGMKERVLSLGGVFELNSSVNKGTDIMVRLPVTITDKT